jgi:hypothetical protein
MTELQRTILTSALTVGGGVIVFVAGNVFTRFIIEPLQDWRRFKGELADALAFHADVYTYPPASTDAEWKTASVALRRSASQLLGRVNAIPCYSLLSSLHLVPHWSDVWESHRCLIGISNSPVMANDKQNMQWALEVHRRLSIRAGSKGRA